MAAKMPRKAKKPPKYKAPPAPKDDTVPKGTCVTCGVVQERQKFGFEMILLFDPPLHACDVKCFDPWQAEQTAKMSAKL